MPRYRDVGISLNRRIGQAFRDGVEPYEKDLPPYEKNWHKGDLTFALDALDHALEHLQWYTDKVLCSLNGVDFEDHCVTILGDTKKANEIANEDHLGHLGANLVMLDRFERLGYFNAPDEVPDEMLHNLEIKPAPEPNPIRDEKSMSEIILSKLGLLVKGKVDDTRN